MKCHADRLVGDTREQVVNIRACIRISTGQCHRVKGESGSRPPWTKHTIVGHVVLRKRRQQELVKELDSCVDLTCKKLYYTKKLCFTDSHESRWIDPMQPVKRVNHNARYNKSRSGSVSIVMSELEAFPFSQVDRESKCERSDKGWAS